MLAWLLFCPTPTNSDALSIRFTILLKKMCAPPPSGQGPVYKYILLINFCVHNVCFKLGVKLLVGSLTGQHGLSTLCGQHCPFWHQILWVNLRVMTTRTYRIFVLGSLSCFLLAGGFLGNTMCLYMCVCVCVCVFVCVQVATCKLNCKHCTDLLAGG